MHGLQYIDNIIIVNLVTKLEPTTSQLHLDGWLPLKYQVLLYTKQIIVSIHLKHTMFTRQQSIYSSKDRVL